MNTSSAKLPLHNKEGHMLPFGLLIFIKNPEFVAVHSLDRIIIDVSPILLFT